MDIKKIIVHKDNSQTKTPSLAAEVEVALPLPSVEVLDNERDGVNTPTSPVQIIKPIVKCPPAPRKPKAAPLRKRKGLYSIERGLLDFSNDVLAMYPPALLADFGNKVKRAKKEAHTDQQQQQHKENICTNVNCFTS